MHWMWSPGCWWWPAPRWRLRGDYDVGMLILTGLFTVTTAPVIAHRVDRLAHREQNLRDSLTIDEMAPESLRHPEREQDSGYGTD
jgi:hypothetical protein